MLCHPSEIILAIFENFHPKAPFLDLEMMGEGGGNGASWWEGRVWAEMRRMMSNPAKCHKTNQ